MDINSLIVSKPKKVLIIPIILFILSITILYINYSNHGYLIDRDISLKGGISVTIYQENIDINSLEQQLTEKFKKS